MATEAFNFGTPANPDNSDGGQVYVFGCEWQSSLPGTCTGGRWRRSTNQVGVLCYMLLYRKSDQALLASRTFTPSAGDNDVTFVSSVDIDAATRYVSAVLADRYAYTLAGWPFTTEHMTAPAAVNGRLITTTAGNPTYPANVHGAAANFFIGPLFEADPEGIVSVPGRLAVTQASGVLTAASASGLITPASAAGRITITAVEP